MIVAACAATPARAEGFAGFGTSETVVLVIFLAAIFAAVTFSVMYLNLRRDQAVSSRRAAALEAELRSRLDRAEAELASDDRVTVSWTAGRGEPEIVGETARVPGLPPANRLLAFGAWLEPDMARAIDQRIEALRERGEPFRLMLRSPDGAHVEADGRPVGAAVRLRLRDVSEDRRAAVELQAENAALTARLERGTRLVESLVQPVWHRDETGRLIFANEAYARAVEAKDGAEAVERAAEFLDEADRAAARRAIEAERVFRKRAPAVFAGSRRVFDVVEAPSAHGAAAIAIDVSELEDVRADLSRQMDAHRRTLDELATAVAMFRADGVLAFHNQAYAKLWGLDQGFLEGAPTDSAILDRLRADRALPEQADFRTWKAQLHAAYRAIEPIEHWWHLPDRRTLRVVIAPNPQGGVTYLFDDVTKRLELESSLNALSKVQSETIDHLREAVAVFGSDGRLKLHNPAFEKLWKLSPEMLKERRHVEQIFAAFGARHADPKLWNRLKMAMTAMPEERERVAARIDLDDGTIVDVITLPLPDGGTLSTFTDVTDSVTVERALRSGAEALEQADKLKLDFVKNVSYELRAPLTNTIGFGQLLADPRTGELTAKQKEYVDYIVASSSALLAIINHILDLATIDAGAMELNARPVEARDAIETAVEGVRDRLAVAGLDLEIDAPAEGLTFVGDPQRVRQVLFNLLSNAIGFSRPGVAIKVGAAREENHVVFRVADQGAGIAPDVVEKVFDRFEGHAAGAHQRGVGLGLSIVKSLVELHGGTVALKSTPGEGTVVTCRFPVAGPQMKAAE